MCGRRRFAGSMAIAALALPHLVACGGDAKPAGGSSAAGAFRATIDGEPWVADASSTQMNASAAAPGAVTISGTRVSADGAYLTLQLTLGHIHGAKSYALGVNHGTNAGGLGQITEYADGTIASWLTDLTGARGTLTVTSLTAARLAATFEFTAPPTTGSPATSTRTVTGGSFELPLPTTFQLPDDDDHGSAIAAMVNGEPWNGATIVALGDTSAGAVAFGGTTTGVSINFTTATTVQEGNSYDRSGIRITATHGDGSSWGGTNDVTSVTITSLTETRVAGTFSGTLAAGAGAAAPLAITGGTFDVRLLAAR